MKFVVALLLACLPLSGQVSFVQASSGSHNTPAATTVSTTATGTTAGNLLFAYWHYTGACVAPGVVNAPTDTAGNTYIPIAPAVGGGSILGVRVIDGGTGYTTGPTVTLNGGGGTGATFNSDVSGGQVIAVHLSEVGSGYTSIPTVEFSGGGGTGATAEVIAIGIGTADHCNAMWYAKNITGHASNVVTMVGPDVGYAGISVLEFSGLHTTAPLHTSFGATTASDTTLTSPSFSTSVADTVVVAGSRVQLLSQTWTAGSASICAEGGGSCTIPTNATVPGTFASAQYKILSSTATGTVSMSSDGAASRALMGAVFKIAGGEPPAPATRQRRIIN